MGLIDARKTGHKPCVCRDGEGNDLPGLPYLVDTDTGYVEYYDDPPQLDESKEAMVWHWSKVPLPISVELLYGVWRYNGGE